MKKINKENQAQKILTTAFHCLAAKGYANVSMRDIADEAGVALSQLHYYYKNKEGLFNEVVKMMIRQYLTEIDIKLRTSAGAGDKMANLVSYFKELVKKKPELLKLFIDFTAQSLWSPSLGEQLKNFFQELTAIIARDVLEEPDEPFTGCSASEKARLVLGALYGVSLQTILDDGKNNNIIKALNMMPCLVEN